MGGRGLGWEALQGEDLGPGLRRRYDELPPKHKRRECECVWGWGLGGA